MKSKALFLLLPSLLSLFSCSQKGQDTQINSNPFGHSPIRVTCVGNSITEGYALQDPASESYPTRLQEILGSAYQVTNCGISSHTALNKTDFPYMNPVSKDRHPFHDALQSDPDIVTIKLGTNDSKTFYDSLMHADFTHDYCALIDSFQALPSRPLIYICLPIPAFEERWSIRDSVISNEIIPRLQQIASDRHLPVIDLYTVFKPYPELLVDGIHPNRAGAMLIAEEIARKIMLDNAYKK